MAKHVTVVAILLLVQAAFEGALGLLLISGGAMIYAAIFASAAPASGGMPPEVIPVLYLVMGLPLLAAAVLRIVAAIRNLRYRSRVLGIVALSAGVLSMFSCYCLPTAAALMVYGLVVYLNEETFRAFALGESGLAPDAIRERLARPGESDPTWQGGHFR